MRVLERKTYMTDMKPKFDIEKLNLHYGAFHALKDINMQIDEHKITAFIGPSGCGKSTTLRMITGLDEPTSGDIYIDGKKINDLTPGKRDIAMVFQNYALYPTMTVRENIEFGLENKKVPKEERKKRVQEICEVVGLTQYLDRKPATLSGGQRQALTLLMATMNPPKLLLLDEHTAALDPGTAEKVLDLTRRIVEENQLTCLMITHNMQSAIDLGNRILMMDSGNIVLDIGGEEKKNMTVDGLLEKFKTGAGKALDNDRILLSD